MTKAELKIKAKKILRNQLQKWLAIFSRKILDKYDPTIVGVTGSVGKTSTKEAIYTVLRSSKKTRRNRGNFNTEFGFPMTIIGDYQRVGGYGFWTRVLIRGAFLTIFPEFIANRVLGHYPEVLVLEYAADKPGDLKYLISIARPDITVLTAIGDVPVHVEFYDSPEQVAKEKSRLIEALSSSGVAILNCDEDRVLALKEKNRGETMYFGFGEKADLKVSAFETRLETIGKGIPKKPIGISFKLEHGDNFVPIRINGTLGRSQAYAAAAAAMVATSIGLNLVQIADAFTHFPVPSQRMKLMSGMNQSYIMDDSYNASPIAMNMAFETIAEIRAKRKIAVLGDMLELGHFSDKAHDAVGKEAANLFKILITVGEQGRRMANAAIKTGMLKRNVFSFDAAHDAEIKLLEILRKGDLVLIKGSKAMDLKLVAEAATKGRIID
ncbi:MAG: hypothetical protein COU09_02020 [Candidatus Harrisonbacteria bacterium CG10_big_fil_rev_8_21_14_0_10_44_23]|uniref:UDP-N-acetylmuramoyl-tripeptide--D-alanyl-D-alanine ligase n=1 Tax=Candidatus Harrisonbacteria bacterium CG10_big_fil_rev_8_21_14_0_10_44_23 TaxID=1974585 RepID=A0A2H0UQ27_9BACT|nr:MAG: hypothetical protein COU09_02020 [Candidatus Harrisonbacteria bacterium CG10_big_fil_rev_8_21_14_0_10_44_23]